MPTCTCKRTPFQNRYGYFTGKIHEINGKKRHIWTSPKGLFYKIKTKNGHERRYWVELNPNHNPAAKGAMAYAPPSTSPYY